MEVLDQKDVAEWMGVLEWMDVLEQTIIKKLVKKGQRTQNFNNVQLNRINELRGWLKIDRTIEAFWKMNVVGVYLDLINFQLIPVG